MNPTKRLTGVCSECGGSIQFPAELVGTMTTCPVCKKQTELTLAAPPEEPAVPRKVIIWTGATVVVLALGVVERLVVGGQKVGVARGYGPGLEAGAKWQFKVPVGEAKAGSSRLASIKEGQ